MAYSPIALTVPQYHVGGVPASGYVLKAYQAATSTVLQMATDSAAGTLVNDVVLDSAGYPSVSGNVIIPHVNANYKLSLYPSETAADANSGAVWTIDNLTPTGISVDQPVAISTVSALRTYTGIATTVVLKGSAAAGDGSGGTYFLTTGSPAGTYTDDGYKFIVPSGGNGSSAWVRIDTFVSNRSEPETHNADYTLVLTDSGKTLQKTAADTTTRTWTIPLNSSVEFPIGTFIYGQNFDDNNLTITANSTATLLNLNGATPSDSDVIVSEGESFELYKYAADAWSIKVFRSLTGLTLTPEEINAIPDTFDLSFSVGGGADVTIADTTALTIGDINITVSNNKKLVVKKARYWVRDSASGTGLRFRITHSSFTTWTSTDNQDDESPDHTLVSNTSGSSVQYAAVSFEIYNNTGGSLNAQFESAIWARLAIEDV